MITGRILKFCKIKFPWRLEIHCWGGLGSQLFAWAFAEELQSSGFTRKIILVLHSSGVTKRISEIDHLSDRIQIKNVQDFSLPTQPSDTFHSIDLSTRFRGRLVSFLSAMQVVILSDDFQKIRPWTIQLRSHYSNRSLSSDTLRKVMSTLKEFSTEGAIGRDKIATTAIHYRLGDLLTLQNKTFVSADRVVLALEKINYAEELKLKSVDVYSDSPKVAIEKLSRENEFFQFNSVNRTSWDVMVELLKYPKFIATNSKIGIWVTLLRLLEDSTQATFVPKELASTFKLLLPNESDMNRINFY